MNRRNETAPFESEWNPSAGALVLNADSRWAIVSTTVSALIVGSVAWLAVSTMPPVTAGSVENASRGFLPYRLFQQLTQSSSSALFGSTAPAALTAPQPATQDHASTAAPAPRSTIETHTVTLDSGDTLAGALENAGIAADDANAAIAALSKVVSPRSLRAGQAFDITYNTHPDVVAGNNPTADEDDGDLTKAKAVQGEPIARLLTIRFSPSIEHDVVVTRAADGSYSANDTVKKLVAREHRAGASIDGSLYLSAMRAGIPTDVVAEMIKMYSYKVDFQRDLHPGDSFEVFYNYYYTPEGQPAKQGAISYAVMRLGGKQIVLYRYQSDPNTPPEYFDSTGESAKGMLMKTPVDGARITSGFGMRFHPVLGYSRMHKGVDFGVPIGTPVMAAGAGTIAFMGWESGYGRFVLLNHGNGYSTAYGHLSRFGPGLHVGSRVGQAQIIAYSGNTGMTTGPHLHYEIHVNNVQVNPLSVKMAQGRKLAGKEMRAFQSERLRIDDKLASTKLETKVADATVAANLRSTSK
ncbi:MAG: M23 family metallopeptidase [Rhizomicrobium sp.]|nr:M23 family metallopeptidase [Rhizomicrobium sp.]